MMGVPTYYTRLLAEAGFTREACRNIRLFVSGSAPLLPETFDAFRARSGQAILERYGMTETGMIASNPLAGLRAAGSVGRPLPGIAVRVVDGEGGACSAGTLGSVEVRGPNVFAGYWRMPENTRKEFTADGWFRTGDIGEWVADGEAGGYLRLAGRSKDMIISGGLNVYPKEIEECLDGLPGVAESAVIGVADPDFGEAVTAIVVARPGHVVDEASIIAALKDEIAKFKVPKRVHVVVELPRNAMGKVQKNVLREKFSA
jgi:malonyl-CoA/methylmalonyl-CoA synthetase